VATAYIREYASLAQAANAKAQAPQEPGLTSQAVATSASSAQSAAFQDDTLLIAISTPAAQAVCVEFGANPTAATATSLRLPSNNVFFFGVKPGQKVAFIDVT